MQIQGRTKHIGFDLAIKEVDASELLRIGKKPGNEPFFGRSGTGRYSDPSDPISFGSCYAAYQLATAIAETVIHDQVANEGTFRVPMRKIEEFYVHELEADHPLQLVDFTGSLLRQLNINPADLLSPTDISHPQRWAKELHDYSKKIDGIEYTSRQLSDSRAVALFCRSKQRCGLRAKAPQRLVRHKGFKTAINNLKIRISQTTPFGL